MNVIFFPRNDYPNNIEVCGHRFGKSMTYTECTDYFDSYARTIADMAIQYGIKGSIFANPYWGTDQYDFLKQAYKDGTMWFDIYFWSEKLRDERDAPSNPEHIVSKATFDYTYYDYLLPYFKEFYGNVKPIALSYSQGYDNYSNYAKELFLGGRNSNHNYHNDYGYVFAHPEIAYGDQLIPYNINSFISRPNFWRIWDSAYSHALQGDPNAWNEALEQIDYFITESIEQHGWLVNFTHWHDLSNGRVYPEDKTGWYEDYFKLLKRRKDADDIYFAGYGEAVAYLVYRQLITRAVMYSPLQNENNQLVICLESRNTLNIDTDLLQIPISIKFSTTGTPLAGQTIKSNCNLINLGGSNYIVEIPYNEYACAVIERVSN